MIPVHLYLCREEPSSLRPRFFLQSHEADLYPTPKEKLLKRGVGGAPAGAKDLWPHLQAGAEHGNSAGVSSMVPGEDLGWVLEV